MAIAPTLGLPKEIQAGDTLSFSLSYPGYPATSYGLLFCLNLDGVSLSPIEADASGSDFIVNATATVTAAWKPGRYNVACYITQGSDRTLVQSGQASVAPNMAVTQTATQAQLLLAACESAYISLLANKRSSVSFNGQSFTFQSIRQLSDMRDRLRAEVQAEQRKAGYSKQGGAKVLVTRFKP